MNDTPRLLEAQMRSLRIWLIYYRKPRRIMMLKG